jgi:hypothetical protein
MQRVARRAIVVNDLRRGYLPAGLIWLVTRLACMNRLTKHDAVLSVLKSRTVREYRALAEMAGLSSAEIKARPFWRVSLVASVDQ